MKKAIIAALMLCAAAITFGQVDANRVVATVNGVEIKGGEYYRRMEFLPGVGKNLGDGFAEFPPGFLTLEQLITEKLVMQLAKQKNVVPSDAEVQAELDYRKTKNPKLAVDWMASGRSMQELTDRVRYDLTQFKLVTAGITVTDQEVDNFYKDPKNKPMFTLPRRATLRVIVARDEKEVDVINKELQAGKSFAEVAKAHSADVTSVQGGEYGTVPLSALADNVRNSVATTADGKMTPWFVATDGKTQFRFLVEKTIPESIVPLDADLRRQMRQKLMVDKGQVKNDLKKELNEMRSKASIDIKEKSFADAYKKFIDAYLKVSGG